MSFLPWNKRPDGESREIEEAESKPSTPERPSIRIRYPEGGYEEVLSNAVSKALEEYVVRAYNTRMGDVQARIEVEEIVLSLRDIFFGILFKSHPELAETLYNDVERARASMCGTDLWHFALSKISGVIAQSGMFGRKAKGLSVDDGRDLGAILSDHVGP